jgi:CBS domain-containing protein
MSDVLHTPVKELAQTTVRNAMHAGVLTCVPDASLRSVAGLLSGNGVHAIIVYEEEAPSAQVLPWGVISAQDLVAAALVRDVDEQVAAATAATPVVLIDDDETLERAAQLMTEHAVTHLVVVDRETAHPVGVLSTLDVAAALSGIPIRSGAPGARVLRTT